MKLDNVRLLVVRFDEMFHFYRDALGLTPTWGDPAGPYASFDLPGGGSIGLFRREIMASTVGTAARPPEDSAQDRFNLVLRVDDVDALAVALGQRGVALLGAPRDMPSWGLRVAHLRDPDGNLLELIQDLPGDALTSSFHEDETVSLGGQGI
ncbi:VOC family protein [Chondromyces apiculatus]|uniref:Lyase n=1 Tax=Chondromyces apiculatus DSM 436 TaxID=1192034 RepID=A0A017T5S4_9BACT|nr:VOC family protein [Chondromyces apiculatus]EYF04150.1 lyase [Chondromyces apiculatus DSM 436]